METTEWYAMENGVIQNVSQIYRILAHFIFIVDHLAAVVSSVPLLYGMMKPNSWFGLMMA